MTTLFLSQKSYCNFFFSAAIISCLAIANAYAQTGAAQTEEAQEATAKNSLFGGSWALQFQINNNFSLSSFQGATLSAKRHFSNRKAMRLGISLGGGVSDLEDQSNITGAKFGRSGNSQSIGINAQYTIYPSPDKIVNVFFGAGPIVGFSRSSSTITSTPDSFSSTRNKAEETTWSAGISGILGVEWFATRNISFIAEYASSLGYNSSNRKETAEQKTNTSDYIMTNETEGHTKGFQFNPNAVKFGLSVYF